MPYRFVIIESIIDLSRSSVRIRIDKGSLFGGIHTKIVFSSGSNMIEELASSGHLFDGGLEILTVPAHRQETTLSRQVLLPVRPSNCGAAAGAVRSPVSCRSASVHPPAIR